MTGMPVSRAALMQRRRRATASTTPRRVERRALGGVSFRKSMTSEGRAPPEADAVAPDPLIIALCALHHRPSSVRAGQKCAGAGHDWLPGRAFSTCSRWSQLRRLVTGLPVSASTLAITGSDGICTQAESTITSIVGQIERRHDRRAGFRGSWRATSEVVGDFERTPVHAPRSLLRGCNPRPAPSAASYTGDDGDGFAPSSPSGPRSGRRRWSRRECRRRFRCAIPSGAPPTWR